MSSVRDRLTSTSFAVLGLLVVRPYSAYELAAQMRRSFVFIWPRAVSGIYEEPKRLVRAAFRATLALFPAGIDLVVIVRRPLGERKLAAVVSEWEGARSSIARRVAEVLARAGSRAKASPPGP